MLLVFGEGWGIYFLVNTLRFTFEAVGLGRTLMERAVSQAEGASDVPADTSGCSN
jgi:hypothetical protein